MAKAEIPDHLKDKMGQSVLITQGSNPESGSIHMGIVRSVGQTKITGVFQIVLDNGTKIDYEQSFTNFNPISK